MVRSVVQSSQRASLFVAQARQSAFFEEACSNVPIPFPAEQQASQILEMDIRSHAGLTEDAITALDPALMEPPLTIPQGLRNPADIFFQKDVVRRTIIATYWAVILLAIPLWWHTTNIERLPLPEARVAQQVDRPFSIPVEICLRGKDAGYASRLEQTLKPVPGSRWDGLEIRVTGGACSTYYLVPLLLVSPLTLFQSPSQGKTHTQFPPALNGLFVDVASSLPSVTTMPTVRH